MLPFTADVFFSLMARYNAAVWPLPVIGWLICIAAVGLTFRPSGADGRLIAFLLASVWAWTGVVFHQLFLANIFFAAPLFAAAFVAQALLFAWAGAFRRTAFRFRSGSVTGAGLGVVAFALFAWPVLDWLASGEWRSARLAGTSPAPTAAFTLGILLLAEGRPPLILAIIPLAWALIAGAGAWVLDFPEAISLPLAGLGALGLMLWQRRKSRESLLPSGSNKGN